MKPIYPNKRLRFIGNANRRTNKVLRAITILGHCSNKVLNEYSQSEVKKIFEAIEDHLILTKHLFIEKEVSRFKLEDDPKQTLKEEM